MLVRIKRKNQGHSSFPWGCTKEGGEASTKNARQSCDSPLEKSFNMTLIPSAAAFSGTSTQRKERGEGQKLLWESQTREVDVGEISGPS